MRLYSKLRNKSEPHNKILYIGILSERVGNFIVIISCLLCWFFSTETICFTVTQFEKKSDYGSLHTNMKISAVSETFTKVREML